MPDREKVIRALELCKYNPAPGQEKKWYHSCLKCGYCTDSNRMEMDCAQMYTDAITLLREHDEPKCGEDTEEVEVLTSGGHTEYWDDETICQGCGTTWIAYDKADQRVARYCPGCGKKVHQE